MAGNLGVMKLIYEFEDGDNNVLRIWEGANLKNYNNKVDRNKDKVYYIETIGKYRYTSKDASLMASLIINNKQLEYAKLNEYNKFIRDISNMKLFNEESL